jgi:hypothetical protein
LLVYCSTFKHILSSLMYLKSRTVLSQEVTKMTSEGSLLNCSKEQISRDNLRFIRSTLPGILKRQCLSVFDSTTRLNYSKATNRMNSKWCRSLQVTSICTNSNKNIWKRQVKSEHSNIWKYLRRLLKLRNLSKRNSLSKEWKTSARMFNTRKKFLYTSQSRCIKWSQQKATVLAEPTSWWFRYWISTGSIT